MADRMRCAFVMPVVVATVGMAVGQEAPARPAEICRYIDVRALLRFDEGLDVEALPLRRAPDRFAEVLSRWWRERAPTSRPRPVEVGGNTLHAHAAPEIVHLTVAALRQLQNEGEVVRARIQVAWLALPPAAVAAEGLKPGVASPADAPVLTRLARVVAGQGGELRNLPEVVASPLRPFVQEHVSGGEVQPLRLRGELVPLERDAALLGLHVVRGALPANPVSMPTAGASLLASPVLKLAAGDLVLLPIAEGERITLVAVRCVEIGPAVVEPKSGEAQRAK